VTAPALQQEATTTVVGQVASCAEDLAALVGGCLVESADGRLVAHRVTGDVPPAVLSALLAGDTRALQAGLTRPRTTCLLPSGPVVEGTLRDGGQRLAHVRLRSGGSIWLLPTTDRPLVLDRLLPAVQLLDELLVCRVDDSGDLTPWLDGDEELPAELTGRVLRLARVDAPGVSPHALLRTITCGLAVRHRGGVYVVLADGALPRPQLDRPIRVVVSSPTTDLVRARRQLDAALAAVPLGECRTVAEVRSTVVLRHLADALASLPDLGDDPLCDLLAHDRRRGGDLTGTLTAWLDAGCDVVRTAEALGVHSNTLRYRLRRISELIGTDLRYDAAARLELHLRLSSTKA
jgi:hypothetical protein